MFGIWLKALRKCLREPGKRTGLCFGVLVATGLIILHLTCGTLYLARAGKACGPACGPACSLACSSGTACGVGATGVGAFAGAVGLGPTTIAATASNEGEFDPSCQSMGNTCETDLAGGCGHILAAQSKLPQWPEEFGKPHNIVRASRWPGYKAVMGPDSTIWCITLDNPDGSKGVLVLTRIDKNMTVKDTLEIEPLQGDMVNFDVAVLNDSAILFWAEKRGDDYHILAKQIWLPREQPEGSFGLSNTWTFLVVGSVVQDVAVSVTGDKVFFGWIDQEEGRPGAFISQVEAGIFESGSTGTKGTEYLVHLVQKALQGLPRVRISDPGVSVSSISLLPAPDGVWASWVQAGQIVNRIMLAPYLDCDLKPAIQILQTAATDLRGIAPLVAEDGLCHLIFNQGRVHKGSVRRPFIVYAIVNSDGHRLMEPVSITQGEGHVVAPSAVFADGSIAIVWSDNRDGKFQVHHALVQIPAAFHDVTGNSEEPANNQASGNAEGSGSIEGDDSPGQETKPVLLSYGAATLLSKECLYPEVFVFEDGTRGILYQVYLAEGDMLLQGVSSLDPVEPGWAYYLGLDLENPVQDGLFRLVTALAAALSVAFLAVPSLAVGVGLTMAADRLNIFSETATGVALRLLFLFGVVFVMKKPGAWYYLFAPVLPHSLSWLSFGLASVAAICLDIQSLSHPKDLLPTALAGGLFVFFDSLFSIILKGVGLV